MHAALRFSSKCRDLSRQRDCACASYCQLKVWTVTRWARASASGNTVALFLEKEWMRPLKSARGLDTSLFFNKSNMCTNAALPSAFEVLDI